MKIKIHSTRGLKSFTFAEDVKASKAAQDAVQAFDFPVAHQYGLLLSGNTSTPLGADRTLDSYGIHDGAALFLTITSC